MYTDISLPYHVNFSNKSFDNTIYIPITIKDTEPCLVLHFKYNEDFGRLQLIEFLPSIHIHKTNFNRLSFLKGLDSHYMILNEDQYKQGIKELA